MHAYSFNPYPLTRIVRVIWKSGVRFFGTGYTPYSATLAWMH